MGAARVGMAAGALCCALAAGCGDNGENSAPAATVAARATSTTSTAPPSTTTTTAAEASSGTIEQEVEEAYLRSWDVYADAMLRLDPSGLEEVYSGDALELRRHEIAELVSQNRPAQMRVDHDYEVAVVSAGTALVFDTYVNHSVYLDAATMQPVEPDPNNVLEREYVLLKEPGGWRVTQANVGS